MVKVTEHQLTVQQSSIIDIYQGLEQDIFKLMVSRLKNGVPDDVASVTDMLRWQIDRLAELHALNNDTVAAVSNATGIAKDRLTTLFKELGYKYAKGEYQRIGNATGTHIDPQNIDILMSGYLNQTFLALDNNVNQTLISTNHGDDTAATRMYQQIIKQTVAQVIAGGNTPRRALADTVYKWRDKGIKSGMIDKGGHSWGIDTYARMVINTTTHRAYQAVRDQAADDYGIDIFLMTSHPAAREACATIQGHLVTTRPRDFETDNTHEHVYSLDNWGYGEPAGTFGINCRHQKWAYIPGVNTNNQKQYDPDEAEANGDIQQQQRALERRVRAYKNNLDLAEELGDDEGVNKYKLLIRQNQSALRQLVNKHSFLTRDYSREKSFGFTRKDVAALDARYKINVQRFNKHVEGSKEYSDYKAKRERNGSKYPPSTLSISAEQGQLLINKYGHRRLAQGYDLFDAGYDIGDFIDSQTGEHLPTSLGRIAYSKKGAHITPLDPRKGLKK